MSLHIKCPNCFEELASDDIKKCPHCQQYILDDCIHADFPSVDAKPCTFCGRPIRKEARVCKHCHRWLDELSQAVEDIDPEDLV